MIVLTKLDSKKILINLDSIKYIESIPDTLIFFINGESVIVREKLEEVRAAIISYKAQVLAAAEQMGGSGHPAR